jgi:hypothetical protein
MQRPVPGQEACYQMLSDQQLSDRLRAGLQRELAAINPSADLLERLRAEALDDGVEPSVRANKHWRARLTMAGGAVWLAASVLAVVIVAGVFLLAGAHQRAAPNAAGSSRAQLVKIIAVLRRPQTKADLQAEKLPTLKDNRLLGRVFIPDRSLIRLATTTPWGEKIYFVPLRPRRAGSRAHAAPKYLDRRGQRTAIAAAGLRLLPRGGAKHMIVGAVEVPCTVLGVGAQQARDRSERMTLSTASPESHPRHGGSVNARSYAARS